MLQEIRRRNPPLALPAFRLPLLTGIDVLFDEGFRDEMLTLTTPQE